MEYKRLKHLSIEDNISFQYNNDVIMLWVPPSMQQNISYPHLKGSRQVDEGGRVCHLGDHRREYQSGLGPRGICGLL